MKTSKTAPLPPIAVEEKPEKLTLTYPVALKAALDEFSAYFEATTGSIPSSFNAVVVGILTGYLETHPGFRKWLRSRSSHGRKNGLEASAPLT
jgi:hypothetical protein